MEARSTDGKEPPPPDLPAALASLTAVCVERAAAANHRTEEPQLCTIAVSLEQLIQHIKQQTDAGQETPALRLWLGCGPRAVCIGEPVPVSATTAVQATLPSQLTAALHQVCSPVAAVVLSPVVAPAADAAPDHAHVIQSRPPQQRQPKRLLEATGTGPAGVLSPEVTATVPAEILLVQPQAWVAAAVVGADGELISADADEAQKETWLEGSKRIKANPPRARTIPFEWKEKVSPEYALAQVAKWGGVNILQDERNKHISWRKVARSIETDLQLRPRGNCNQILKKMIEDATGLDLRQRVSQVVGDCAFVVRRRGKADKGTAGKKGDATPPQVKAEVPEQAKIEGTAPVWNISSQPQIVQPQIVPTQMIPPQMAQSQLVQPQIVPAYPQMIAEQMIASLVDQPIAIQQIPTTAGGTTVLEPLPTLNN